MLTIPEYFKRFVDRNVDLTAAPKLKCPFHNERHGQSFSYSIERETWRCFGACKAGGDVFDLHRLNYNLPTRGEAERHLKNLLGIKDAPKPPLPPTNKAVNAKHAAELTAYGNAVRAAKSTDDWVELDRIMSVYPPDTNALKMFTNTRGEPKWTCE